MTIAGTSQLKPSATFTTTVDRMTAITMMTMLKQ